MSFRLHARAAVQRGAVRTLSPMVVIDLSHEGWIVETEFTVAEAREVAAELIRVAAEAEALPVRELPEAK